jgi:hypothetical protein
MRSCVRCPAEPVRHPHGGRAEPIGRRSWAAWTRGAVIGPAPWSERAAPSRSAIRRRARGPAMPRATAATACPTSSLTAYGPAPFWVGRSLPPKGPTMMFVDLKTSSLDPTAGRSRSAPPGARAAAYAPRAASSGPCPAGSGVGGRTRAPPATKSPWPTYVRPNPPPRRHGGPSTRWRTIASCRTPRHGVAAWSARCKGALPEARFRAVRRTER